MTDPLDGAQRAKIEMMLSALVSAVQADSEHRIQSSHYVRDVDALLRELVRLERESVTVNNLASTMSEGILKNDD